MLRIDVIGRFQVVRLDCTDLTPRGRKACGLLALLALAPHKSRTRVWLQDKLWSDRGPEQAAGSLRQCLSEIRRTFGSSREVLVTDNTSIGLDPNAIVVDVDNLPRALAALSRTGGTPELLEGMDIRDPEFEDWLRVIRQAFAEETAALGVVAAAPAPEPADRPLRPRLVVATDPACPPGDRAVAGFLAHRVAQGVAEATSVCVEEADAATGGVRLTGPTDGLQVRAAALREGHETALRVSLLSEDGKEVVWSIVRTVPELAESLVDSPLSQQLQNQAIDAAVEILRQRAVSAETKKVVAHFALDAVRRIFRLSQPELDEADRLLVRAQELDPRGIYPAWRGFLRTVLVGERRPFELDDLRLESEALVQEAIEREPNNSMVYALAAHVNYLVLDNDEAAMMLAETSLALNAGNSLAYAHLGAASAHAGHAEDGHRHALTALAICGNGPYRYQIMNACSVTAMLTGRYAEAVRYAECARALAPDYLPPIRSLAALYFHDGNLEKASRFVRELRRREPGFTLDLLRDEGYPAATLRATPLIEIANARELSAS